MTEILFLRGFSREHDVPIILNHRTNPALVVMHLSAAILGGDLVVPSVICTTTFTNPP